MEAIMTNGFHEVSFPMSVALGTTGGPERRNDIVLMSNGHESRNARWRDARRRYDAGSGMKSTNDLYALIAFFEARQGSLNGFRFKDPLDYTSADYGLEITPFDQEIGIGDGVTTQFYLQKTYADIGGETVRHIQKPVAGSVQMSVEGVEILTPDFAIDTTTGLVEFITAPTDGAMISAGFIFDVPVRFDLARLDINLSNFHAGHVPSVPLVEVKP
jgi:uncharacterized protein (TIGR02217 family)